MQEKDVQICEAFNGWCSIFSSLIKNPSYKHSFFQPAFEAQPACVSYKFLTCCFIIASGF